MTANRRSIFLVLISSVASFALLYGGHWLAYLYVHNKGLNNKDELINVILIDFLFIMPVISIVMGVFVGSLEEKSRFWIAGVSLLPLLVFMLYGFFDGGQLFLSCIYLFLSLISSWLVSLWRYRRKLR